MIRLKLSKQFDILGYRFCRIANIIHKPVIYGKKCSKLRSLFIRTFSQLDTRVCQPISIWLDK